MFCPVAEGDSTRDSPPRFVQRVTTSPGLLSHHPIILGPALDQQPRWAQNWAEKFILCLWKSLHPFIICRVAKRICRMGFSMLFPWPNHPKLSIASSLSDSTTLIQWAGTSQPMILHFRPKGGGDIDAGATPPTPRHCSTRGRVDLPQFCHSCSHRLH